MSRFQAEKLNGRAAMMGYLLAGLVDLATGAGLVEQQESFLGKLMLHVTVRTPRAFQRPALCLLTCPFGLAE